MLKAVCFILKLSISILSEMPSAISSNESKYAYLIQNELLIKSVQIKLQFKAI